MIRIAETIGQRLRQIIAVHGDRPPPAPPAHTP
jgi:hypothetical protein